MVRHAVVSGFDDMCSRDPWWARTWPSLGTFFRTERVEKCPFDSAFKWGKKRIVTERKKTQIAYSEKKKNEPRLWCDTSNWTSSKNSYSSTNAPLKMVKKNIGDTAYIDKVARTHEFAFLFRVFFDVRRMRAYTRPSPSTCWPDHSNNNKLTEVDPCNPALSAYMQHRLQLIWIMTAAWYQWSEKERKKTHTKCFGVENNARS